MPTRGPDKTRRNFEEAAKKLRNYRKGLVGSAIPSGLRLIGEEIMTDVKASRANRGVPVDKGILRATGRVKGPTNGEVELSFGGAAAPYALKQHEDTSLAHTVGEARFLIRATERWTPDGSSAIRALQANARAAARVAQRGGVYRRPARR